MGIPLSPLPITITFEFGDSDNLMVASIPFSCNILSVKEALKMRLAVAFPSASCVDVQLLVLPFQCGIHIPTPLVLGAIFAQWLL